MNFVAIDFETACASRESACAVGLAVVKDGDIVDRFTALIRPPSLLFSPVNVKIHGITAKDVEHEPDFAGIWPELADRIGGSILVAHNAAFDIGVLRACLRAGGLKANTMNYACTYAMSRRLVPGAPNHKLPTLATLFGIDLQNNHHNPSCDAIACARLAIILCRIAGKSIESFACDGTADVATNEYETASECHYTELSTERAIGRCGLVDAAKPDGRFAGVWFVFTGELDSLNRAKAESLVQEYGGQTAHMVSKKTDYVVVGAVPSSKPTAKLRKAIELQKDGGKVKVLRESEFLEMIGTVSPVK